MTARQVHDSYPKLLAPRGDGQLLISPEGRQLLRETWTNQRNLRDTTARIGGVPVSQVRRWMRRWMGHREDQRPIIATGHQTELYHPGVWVKNAVISAAAQRIGAEAIHFAVDTDAPKHLVYRWPGGGRPITDDPELTRARWSGRLLPPTPAYVQSLAQEAKDAAGKWGTRPDSEPFLKQLGMTSKTATLSEAITNAHNASDRALGLRLQTLVASQLTRTTGYLLFVHDICARADEYVRIYNAALADFRRVHGIESPGRPMPDLSHDGDFCEVPFWLDDLADGQRKRASVVRHDSGQWALRCGEDAFAFDAAAKDAWQVAEYLGTWLSRAKLRLSPRALTLTSFLRLAVVDQFVHGIGGAIYDQVTDRLLQNWYGIEPPAFSVGTVTLYFPAAIGRQRTCLECIAREGRDLRHSALGARKMELVRQILDAPRHSAKRAILFSQMHRELDAAVASDARIAEHASRYAEARESAAVDNLLFDRELPYTLQSRERLAEVISRVAEAFQ